MITVIGYDGAPLSRASADALANADLVVGARRHLAALPLPSGADTVAMGDLTAALDALSTHDGQAVVLASGDPGFFGIVRALTERGLRFTVHPAVSSVAAAFARIGLSWDDAVVVSAHGRRLGPVVNACRARHKVAVLTAPGSGPAELGAALGGLPRRLIVAERVGLPDERVVECAPDEAARRTWREPNVVLVLGDGRRGDAVPPRGWCWPRPGVPDGWALTEDAFAHRDSMVTKAEVRAVALARLGPRLGELVWDVGAGSGSVAVECARFGAAVVAVDRDEDQCARVRENARRHGVDVTVVTGDAPAALERLPDPDAVFVGGGGTAVVDTVARRHPRRVVVALAAVERLGPAADALAAAGYHCGGAQLQASRLATLPDGTHRLAATNPVLLLWGERR